MLKKWKKKDNFFSSTDFFLKCESIAASSRVVLGCTAINQ